MRNGSSGRALGSGVLALGLLGFIAIHLGILAYAVHTAKPAAEQEPGRDAPQAAGGEQSGAAPSAVLPAPHADSGTAGAQAESPKGVIATPILLPDDAAIRGAYVQHCAACHGLDGRGDGPAAPQLYPRPRDFVDSPFRFASLSGGRDELLAGLERTIATGVPRGPMPGFGGVLSEQMIAGLARYLLGLRSAGMPADPSGEVSVGARPPTTAGLLARGEELYHSTGCVTCHGESGRGDGEQARTLVDSLGRPMLPADFASGFFKSGQKPEDQARVILRGVAGTPMIAYEDVLVKTLPDGSRDLTDLWALVAHIRVFHAGPGSAAVASGASLVAIPAPTPEMLCRPEDPGWIGIEPATLELKPLWQRPEGITEVEVRVVRDERAIAICIDWRDGTMNAERGIEVFPDAVAVMFAMGDEEPALPMGVTIEGYQAKAPVNIWHWQASRQLDATRLGERSAAPSAPASRGLRVFPLVEPTAEPERAAEARPTLPSFATAALAGNVHEDERLLGSPALESNAEGFGTLALQPAERQDVRSASLYSNGVWRAVLFRKLDSGDPMDVRLMNRQRIAVTFAVWDGAKGDRNGLKLITSWHWLIVPSSAAPEAGGSEPDQRTEK